MEIAFAPAAVLLEESSAIELLVTAQKTPTFLQRVAIALWAGTSCDRLYAGFCPSRL
ncbi:hypothetical protein [Scytonema sp. HK-05]|uniref:hypothetical protein n=1 Tax=Scytonema sp. HK-05 TaxID=1137095 RepID=UPI000A750913|nr:hypothetical protein [Scytonema sp. HK-05]